MCKKEWFVNLSSFMRWCSKHHQRKAAAAICLISCHTRVGVAWAKGGGGVMARGRLAYEVFRGSPGTTLVPLLLPEKAAGAWDAQQAEEEEAEPPEQQAALGRGALP